MLQARYAAMIPLEGVKIAMSLRQAAIEIIAFSLPPGLTREERRYAIAKRFYGDELSEAVLRRHAQHREPGSADL